MTAAANRGESLVAIIDIGSNTAKLCVYALKPGQWVRQVDELRAVVRLASGTGPAGELGEKAFERGIAALEQFSSYLRAVGVSQVRATATSAVRSASNGPAFLAAARERAGIELELLSGAEEAVYGAIAVANSFSQRDMLVLDLGGGSMQLSHIKDRQVKVAESWPLGIVVTTERFLKHDPPSADELDALRSEVRRSVTPWLAKLKGRKQLPLIGMGGTIRNLANLDLRSRADSPVDFMHGHALRKAALTKLSKRLSGLTCGERGKLDALSSDRADIIAAGAVVVEEVVKAVGAKELIVSGNGLREGLLATYLLPETEPPLLDDVRGFSVSNLRAKVGRRWPPGRDPDHVAELALAIYDALPNDPRETAFERDLLATAARLHDVGRAIDFRDQHKHGHAIIMGEPLPGFSLREQSLIALQVRYQRSGKPSPNGLRRLLKVGDAERLNRLTGALRLALALDRSGTGRIARVTPRLEAGRLTIKPHFSPAALRLGAVSSPELVAAAGAKALLADAYGISVELAAPA